MQFRLFNKLFANLIIICNLDVNLMSIFFVGSEREKRENKTKNKKQVAVTD
jgi:hypothetical protein